MHELQRHAESDIRWFLYGLVVTVVVMVILTLLLFFPPLLSLLAK